jgi:hypothetical protein
MSDINEILKIIDKNPELLEDDRINNSLLILLLIEKMYRIERYRKMSSCEKSIGTYCCTTRGKKKKLNKKE